METEDLITTLGGSSLLDKRDATLNDIYGELTGAVRLLRSIAESLVKLANPPMALAEDDEYQGG